MSRQRMMQSARARATSGESITEVLVAILIGALAGVMLAVAVTTATGITRRSAKFEEHAAQSVSEAELALVGTTSEGMSSSTATMDFNGAGLPGSSGKQDLKYYLTSTHTELSASDREGYEELMVFVLKTP